MNTIRLWRAEYGGHDLLVRVRHLEYVEETTEQWDRLCKWALDRMDQTKRCAPRLRTVTISDDIKPPKTHPMTVRERFRALSPSIRIRCIDIGLFEIHYEGALKLYYEDTALRRLFPPVQNLAVKDELKELVEIFLAELETLPHGEHIIHIRNAIWLQDSRVSAPSMLLPTQLPFKGRVSPKLMRFL